ncbi:kinase-like domain-containing protein [Chaetomium strumarium]|uniref:Kinase-like domain-containing protein n=1 Tax=Chaetomium strumarium TaxID=1170767 RepID=A0AAJ0GKJ6_9PEZI|nr:kinase-like domain-containing protein [Chaetomium strumarium]
MAHPQSAKVSEEILQDLSGTEYACSSLEPLSGGTANFLFKGILTRRLPDGTQEVAVKHGKAFVASMPDFQLSTARCRAEVECLKAFEELLVPPPLPPPQPTATDQTSPFTVRAPRLHHFSATTNTQVQEYLPNALSLKDYALKHFSASAAPAAAASRKPLCLELGRSLGGWLRDFHQRASSLLRDVVSANEPMQQLKHYVNYGTLVDTVANFPSILGDAKETFEKIREVTAQELQGPDLGVIHGDFWTGNALLSDEPLTEGAKTTVFIVDWEMCQLGVAPVDLGQMIAELYELSLFKGTDEGKWLIEGFAAGYGHVDDQFAFRTALHVGTHLVAWGSRVPGWGSEMQVQQVVGLGKEVILHAWHQDRAWFEAGDLACLFASTQ